MRRPTGSSLSGILMRYRWLLGKLKWSVTRWCVNAYAQDAPREGCGPVTVRQRQDLWFLAQTACWIFLCFFKLAYLIVREWKLPFSIDELGSFSACPASCRKLIGLWYFAQLSTPLYFSIEWPQRRLLPHFELGIFTQGRGGICNLPKFIWF